MAEERTLRELNAPNLAQLSFCIIFPTIPENTSFVLNSDLIHLLPSFQGLASENPYNHLQEFNVVCTSMMPAGVTEDQIKLRAFPFSLKDAAKDWLYNLPPGSISTWEEMAKKFLRRYFPASRASTLRKEICSIQQFQGETLYEYWERFNQLIFKCPNHLIPKHLLIQYFYDGLSFLDRRFVDAASGGALEDKTPDEAWDLINTMAENSQQFELSESGVQANFIPSDFQPQQQQMVQITEEVCEIEEREESQILAWPEVHPKNVSSIISWSNEELEEPKVSSLKEEAKEVIVEGLAKEDRLRVDKGVGARRRFVVNKHYLKPHYDGFLWDTYD